MRLFIMAALVMSILIFPHSGNAEETESTIVLDPVYVTPNRYDEFESRTAGSVCVITRQDIENANVQTAIDLFRSETGIMVKDWTGNGTNASVDIRGFGEQAGMNAAVLVDGRKVNEIDLSGVDWTQIPVNQIERIEIIRGGSGAVLYGENASSGVINIITKTGRGKPYIEYEQKYGSYEMNEENGTLGGKYKNLSYIVTAERRDTNGYRDNSHFNNKAFSSKLKYEVLPDFVLRFGQSWHKTNYGLPGALTSAVLEARDRRASRFWDDYTKNRDYNFTAGADKGLWDWGEVSCDASFRRRKSYTNFITTNNRWNPFLRSKIDTITVNPKYVLNKEIFGWENGFIVGIDYSRSDYNSKVYDITDVMQNHTAINKTSLGVYWQDTFSPFSKLHITGGHRYESAEYEFDYKDLANFWPNPPVNERRKKLARAYNIGVVYEYMKGSEAFFTHNQSFRFPAVDEFFTWGNINLELKQQESRNYEVGARHRINKRIKIGVTGFWMNVENELYYNPNGGVGGWGANENYDKTRHQGLECSAQVKASDMVLVYGNYTYTDAHFRGSDYKGNDIPMVPENKWSTGARVFLPRNFIVNVLGTYVGRRYFINDQANNYPKLKGYFTADANVSYEYKNFLVGVGVINIFNQKFYEYGIRNANTGAANYYPGAGANYYVKARVKF